MSRDRGNQGETRGEELRIGIRIFSESVEEFLVHRGQVLGQSEGEAERILEKSRRTF